MRHLRFVGDPEIDHDLWLEAAAREPVAQQGTTEIYLDTLTMGDSSSENLVGYLLLPNCPLKVSRLRELCIYGVHAPTGLERMLELNAGRIESFIRSSGDDDGNVHPLSPTNQRLMN